MQLGYNKFVYIVVLLMGQNETARNQPLVLFMVLSNGTSYIDINYITWLAFLFCRLVNVLLFIFVTYS